MNNLKSVTKIVKAILEDDKQSRKSDSLLYLRVLKVYGLTNGIDIESMSVPCFLMNMNKYGFPPFESVRRARQKIQATFPELAACGKTSEMRMKNESKFRAFAAGGIHE